MRAREFILREDDATVNPTDAANTTNTSASGAPSTNPQIQQLTAATAALKKQVLDLQKAALAQGSAQTTPQAAPAAPAPGEASQQQVPKGTVGTGTGNGTIDQQQQPAKPGQPMGQPGVPGQAGVATATNQAQQPAPAAPAQKPMPPGVTNMAKTQQDIKNKLIQNVASGK